jgi:pullulanase
VSVGGTSHTMTPTTLSGYTSVYQAVVNGDLKDQSYQFSMNSYNAPDAVNAIHWGT